MMASLIQEDLGKLGIQVTVATLEFRSYIDRIFQSHDYEACLLGLVSGDADPNPEMSLLMSSGAMHLWHLGQSTPATTWEAEIDRLMEEQMTTLDGRRRKHLYDQVQEIVAEHQPIIALASPNILVGATKRLGNFRPGVLPPYTLWNADELYLHDSGTP